MFSEVLREGAQKLIRQAVESELQDMLSQYKDFRDDQDHQ